jgi:hypothetical protein
MQAMSMIDRKALIFLFVLIVAVFVAIGLMLAFAD